MDSQVFPTFKLCILQIYIYYSQIYSKNSLSNMGKILKIVNYSTRLYILVLSNIQLEFYLYSR